MSENTEKRISFSEYIRFYNEEIEDKLQKMINRKSNLLLNLKLFRQEDKKKALKKIAVYELRISDRYIKKGNIDLAADSIFSTINSLLELRDDLCYIIALKGLLTGKFNDNVKNEFFRILKDLQSPNLSNNYEFFKYIIDQYTENSLPFRMQNIIKLPFYIFWKINFEDIFYIKLNPYLISKHPIYSKELSNHLENLKKNKILKIEKTIIPDIHYQIVKSNSNHYRKYILERNPELLSNINQIIEDFAYLNSKQITKWEKDIKILDFFTTSERIL